MILCFSVTENKCCYSVFPRKQVGAEIAEKKEEELEKILSSVEIYMK